MKRIGVFLLLLVSILLVSCKKKHYYRLILPNEVSASVASTEKIAENTLIKLTISVPEGKELEWLKVNDVIVGVVNNTYEFKITANTRVKVKFKTIDPNGANLEEILNFFKNVDFDIFVPDTEISLEAEIKEGPDRQKFELVTSYTDNGLLNESSIIVDDDVILYYLNNNLYFQEEKYEITLTKQLSESLALWISPLLSLPGFDSFNDLLTESFYVFANDITNNINHVNFSKKNEMIYINIKDIPLNLTELYPALINIGDGIELIENLEIDLIFNNKFKLHNIHIKSHSYKLDKAFNLKIYHSEKQVKQMSGIEHFPKNNHLQTLKIYNGDDLFYEIPLMSLDDYGMNTILDLLHNLYIKDYYIDGLYYDKQLTKRVELENLEDKDYHFFLKLAPTPSIADFVGEDKKEFLLLPYSDTFFPMSYYQNEEYIYIRNHFLITVIDRLNNKIYVIEDERAIDFTASGLLFSGIDFSQEYLLNNGIRYKNNIIYKNFYINLINDTITISPLFLGQIIESQVASLEDLQSEMEYISKAIDIVKNNSVTPKVTDIWIDAVNDYLDINDLENLIVDLYVDDSLGFSLKLKDLHKLNITYILPETTKDPLIIDGEVFELNLYDSKKGAYIILHDFDSTQGMYLNELSSLPKITDNYLFSKAVGYQTILNEHIATIEELTKIAAQTTIINLHPQIVAREFSDIINQINDRDITINLADNSYYQSKTLLTDEYGLFIDDEILTFNADAIHIELPLTDFNLLSFYEFLNMNGIYGTQYFEQHIITYMLLTNNIPLTKVKSGIYTFKYSENIGEVIISNQQITITFNDWAYELSHGERVPEISHNDYLYTITIENNITNNIIINTNHDYMYYTYSFYGTEVPILTHKDEIIENWFTIDEDMTIIATYNPIVDPTKFLDAFLEQDY